MSKNIFTIIREKGKGYVFKDNNFLILVFKLYVLINTSIFRKHDTTDQGRINEVNIPYTPLTETAKYSSKIFILSKVYTDKGGIK